MAIKETIRRQLLPVAQIERLETCLHQEVGGACRYDGNEGYIWENKGMWRSSKSDSSMSKRAFHVVSYLTKPTESLEAEQQS